MSPAVACPRNAKAMAGPTGQSWQLLKTERERQSPLQLIGFVGRYREGTEVSAEVSTSYPAHMPSDLSRAVGVIAPTIRGMGFHRFGQTFNREREPGLIQVVGIQGSQSSERFTVNLGIYVREVDQLMHDHMARYGPGLGTTKALRAELCWLEARIGDVGAPGSDWWYYAKSDATAEVRNRLLTEVTKALDASATRSSLIEWWESSPPRQPAWRLYPDTPIGFALLLRDRGRKGDAETVIRQVWSAAHGPFRGTVETYAEELGIPVS